MTHEYEDLRRITYGEDKATFVPVCPRCSKFVRADSSIRGVDTENATCSKCGRVKMLFEGFF